MKNKINSFALTLAMLASLSAYTPIYSISAEEDSSDAEIIFSSDFESESFDIWSPFGGSGSLALDNTTAHSGNNSLRISGRAQTFNGPSINADNMVMVGESYNMSSWVYQDTDEEKLISWTVRFVDSLGENHYAQIASENTRPGEWTELSGTLTVPDDTVATLIYFECSNASDEFNIDDVVMMGKAPEANEDSYKTDDCVYYFDFEKNAGDWRSRGSERLNYTDEYSNTGSYSLYCSNRERTWNGPSTSIVNSGLEREKKYYYSAYVMYNGDEYEENHIFRLELQYSLEGEAHYELIKDREIPKNKWTNIAGTYTLPANAENVSVYIQTDNNEEGVDPDENDLMSFYIDTVSISEYSVIQKKKTMTAAVIAVLSVVLIIAAVIIAKKAKKVNDALDLVYKDAMTNALNRNAYEKKIEELTNEPEKCKSLYVTMCDVNFMKYINDTMGHKKGDEAITRCADILLDIAKDAGGEVYRTGGDEFIYLTDKSVESEVRKSIAEKTAVDKGYPFMVAAGFAKYDESIDGDKPDIKQIISRCDKDMYDDKQKIKAENQKYSR